MVMSNALNKKKGNGFPGNLFQQFRGSQVNRWLLAITAVILLASVSGAVVAFNLPAEIRESVNLVRYQHEGTFDYIAYLKPSQLYGPEPQEASDLPSNQKYPTQFITGIDMTFTYVTVEAIPAEVEVVAILENPDIWQKEITLASATTKTGNFVIEFPLDSSALNQLFDTIDEEIKISSSNRQVTIVASVLSQGNNFVQSLPLRLGRTLVEVDSNRNLTQSGATGEFDYTVYLEENSLYDTRTLKPPPSATSSAPLPARTARPGEPLFTNLTDKMDFVFSYKLKSDKPLSQVVEDVEIRAILENPGAWSKSFVLVPQTSQSGDFTASFTLDMNQRSETLQIIRSEAGISGTSHRLTITADVYTAAQTQFGPITEVFSHSISTPMGEGTLDWGGGLADSKPGSINTSQTVPNQFLGLPVGQARILFSILPVIFVPLFLYLLVVYARFKPAGLPEIESEARRARRKYKDLIIDVQELPATTVIERVISLNALDELITTAEELGKVVLHKAEKEKHTYCVVDTMTRYQYVSEPELPDKDKVDWSS
jgi:hypothetical protein